MMIKYNLLHTHTQKQHFSQMLNFLFCNVLRYRVIRRIAKNLSVSICSMHAFTDGLCVHGSIVFLHDNIKQPFKSKQSVCGNTFQYKPYHLKV